MRVVHVKVCGRGVARLLVGQNGTQLALQERVDYHGGRWWIWYRILRQIYCLVVDVHPISRGICCGFVDVVRYR
jgi:hypothetical protein